MGVPARGSLASRNQSVGIKVLDIKDQPLSFKDARKRKKDEEEKEKKVGSDTCCEWNRDMLFMHVIGTCCLRLVIRAGLAKKKNNEILKKNP